jgi:phage-related protein (TIGR01555 family)
MSILGWFRGEKPEAVDAIEQVEEKPKTGFFSTDVVLPTSENRITKLRSAIKQSIQKTSDDFKALNANGTTAAMDGAETIKAAFQVNQAPISDAQVMWYGSQGFIGYQMAAILSQNWLIDKACRMPGKDAIRKGYEVTVNDGFEVSAETLDKIRAFDIERKITNQLDEYIHMGRVFGIRLALFLVDAKDKVEYYKNPFNIDAVKEGSYLGISQIDPYWITPELDIKSASDPASMSFYEPTWWMINGMRIHRSHFAIYRTGTLPDILKPSYLYGGIPIPQKIYERVYAAERTANEAPMLAMSKRLNVLKVDIEQAMADQAMFESKLQQFNTWRDNFGVYAMGQEDIMEQFDTSLTELDQVIMTQYQIVAAAANVPSTKLLGTAPKGFNATGEFDEANYHEELESMQAHDLTPFLDRHYLLAIKSEFGDAFKVTVKWNPLDSMTAKELAEVNKLKADTGAVLFNTGAIDGQDERDRVINDPTSGYSGLATDIVDEDNLIDDGSVL